MFFILVVVLLMFYWIIPIGTVEFTFASGPKNTNFTLNNSLDENIQFYENMRFPTTDISYRIGECTLQKSDEMERAFDTIENLTLLSFYPVTSNEEITVTCDSNTKMEGNLFIAGEGGPTKITQTENFNVIHEGKILLIRESKCPNPNIAIHELLHVLGFDHSDNPDNIMYYLTSCSQEIGQDTINLINYLYSFPTQPDLAIENVSAQMNGKYLDISIRLRNDGLKISEPSTVIIYADEKPVKEFELSSLGIGQGREITFTNIFILQTRVDEIEVFIDYGFEELNKKNNKVVLKIKEN
jgi:hypothetical protein